MSPRRSVCAIDVTSGVGVVDDPGEIDVAPHPGGHVQRVDHQCLGHGARGLPADDSPAHAVNDESDVDDARPRGAVSPGIATTLGLICSAGWLAREEGVEETALCVEAKNSAEARFHFSSVEWDRTSQLRDEGLGDRYAVLVVRRGTAPRCLGDWTCSSTLSGNTRRGLCSVRPTAT